MSSEGPGYRRQGTARTAFRVVGVVSLVAALVLAGLAVADFFAAFGSDDFGVPSRFWMFFVAVPLFAVAGFCLNAGFAGAGLRYAAGEAAPVAKDTLGYLRGDPTTRCGQCATPVPAGARFCGSCGAAVG